MKIIVCGATEVSKSIVSYLIKGSSDIIVILELIEVYYENHKPRRTKII